MNLPYLQHDIFNNLCLHTAGLLAYPGCLSGIRLHQVAGCEKQQQARYLSAEEFRGSSEAQFAAELQRRIRQAQVLLEARDCCVSIQPSCPTEIHGWLQMQAQAAQTPAPASAMGLPCNGRNSLVVRSGTELTTHTPKRCGHVLCYVPDMQHTNDIAHPELCCLQSAALHVLRTSCYLDTAIQRCAGYLNLHQPCQHKPQATSCTAHAGRSAPDLAVTGSAKRHLLQAEAAQLQVRHVLRCVLHCRLCSLVTAASQTQHHAQQHSMDVCPVTLQGDSSGRPSSPPNWSWGACPC